MGWQRWTELDLDRIDWTMAACDRKQCEARAEVFCDGYLLCVEHADEALDRALALELNPDMRHQLPPLEYNN